jgi:hypothetical protein
MNNKVPQDQLTLTLGRPRERERGERGEDTLVHGEGVGEEGRPKRGLRWPEERRVMAAAAGPMEGLERRKIGVGGN